MKNRYSDRIKNGTLQEDILFTSPSAAAGFVTYASANGMIMWLDKKGRNLKEKENYEDQCLWKEVY